MHFGLKFFQKLIQLCTLVYQFQKTNRGIILQIKTTPRLFIGDLINVLYLSISSHSMPNKIQIRDSKVSFPKIINQAVNLKYISNSKVRFRLIRTCGVFIKMNYPWQACKSALNNQAKKLKFALILKYEDLLIGALAKMRVLNLESFITPRGINYNALLEESELPIKVESKKIHRHLVANKLLLNPTITTKSVSDGVQQTTVNIC